MNDVDLWKKAAIPCENQKAWSAHGLCHVHTIRRTGQRALRQHTIP